VAQRLRITMSYVISRNQSRFIPGRSTLGDIMILQKTCYSLNYEHKDIIWF